MYNILICSCNMNFIKKIINMMPNGENKFIITNIASNSEEIEEMILSGTIDIVIIDNYLSGIDIKNILSIIFNLNIYPYPKIIYYTEIKQELDIDMDYTEVIQLDPKEINNYDVLRLLADNSKEDIKIIEEKVKNELLGMGFNFSHKGTNYIIKTIIFLKTTNNEDFYSNIEKNIYSKIARESHTSTINVKSNVLKAINYAFINNRKNRPKPKDLFYELLSKI